MHNYILADTFGRDRSTRNKKKSEDRLICCVENTNNCNRVLRLIVKMFACFFMHSLNNTVKQVGNSCRILPQTSRHEKIEADELTTIVNFHTKSVFSRIQRPSCITRT